jgi:hypothetical protein
MKTRIEVNDNELFTINIGLVMLERELWKSPEDNEPEIKKLRTLIEKIINSKSNIEE